MRTDNKIKVTYRMKRVRIEIMPNVISISAKSEKFKNLTTNCSLYDFAKE